MAKNIDYITPIGVAVYPHITVPDTTGQYADGKYKTQLEFEPDVFARVKADIMKLAKGMQFKTTRPKMPFKEKDKDGKPTYIIVAKSKFLPMVIDAKRNVIVNKWDPPSEDELRKVNIGGGSRLRLGVELFNYGDGLSLQLTTVQVIERRTNTSNFDGFAVEDDGYDYDGAAPDLSAFDTEDDNEASSALDL